MDSESEDLVSVYTVNSAAEAEIVRNALKEAGIACEIGGEMQAGLAGVLEINILTHVSDADAARKHLRLLRKEKKERHKRRLLVAAQHGDAEKAGKGNEDQADDQKDATAAPET